MHIVFLASVPHTGTAFLQHLIEACVEVKNTVELSALVKNPLSFRDPFTGRRGIDPAAMVNLVKTHLPPPLEYHAKVMAAQFPTAVPLRDPLASMVTFRTRHPDKSSIPVVDQWLVLISRFSTLERQPLYLPVDLLAGGDDKGLDSRQYLALCRLAEHLGLNRKGVLDAGKGWPRINRTANRDDLIAAYRRGDLGQLHKRMPDDITALQNASHIIRPFLLKAGYREDDLIW